MSKNRKTDWGAVNKFWSQNDMSLNDALNQCRYIRDITAKDAEGILIRTMRKWDTVVKGGAK